MPRADLHAGDPAALGDGITYRQLTRADLDETIQSIGESVGEMTEYLQGFDRDRNVPVSKEEWDLALDPKSCVRCPFYELCAPELNLETG